MKTHDHPAVVKGAILMWNETDQVTVVDVFHDRAPGWTRVGIQPASTIGMENVRPRWYDLDEVIEKCRLDAGDRE